MDTNVIENTEVENQELIEAAAETAAEKAPEIDYSKIDYSRLDPTKIPHHIVQQTQPFGGLLTEVQIRRAREQELAEANEALAAELQHKDETDNTDPETPITIGQAKKMIADAVTGVVKHNEKKDAKTQESQQLTRLNESCVKLEQEFAPEKAGEGLDAKSVLTEGVNWLLANRPHLLAAAKSSTDPAHGIYELSINLVPSIRKRADTRKNNQLLNSIHKGRIPQGGGVIPPGQQKSPLLDLLAMPEDQLLAEIEKDEFADEQEE